MTHSEQAGVDLPDNKSLIGPSIMAVGLIVLGLAFWSDNHQDPAPTAAHTIAAGQNI
jgi:hypothetical protein